MCVIIFINIKLQITIGLFAGIGARRILLLAASVSSSRHEFGGDSTCTIVVCFSHTKLVEEVGKMAPSSNMLWLFAVILGVYFLSLDIVLHYKIAGWDPAHPTKNEEEGYDMFNPLSVKLLMIDHASHFIYHPLSELFDQITGFSLLFPFITPNFISFCHLSFALVSAKLIGNDNLCWRQIGVLFFEFRTYLDSLDGVVYRSHSKHSSYNSGWGTSGYFVDIACDILAGLALFVSICFYFYRHHPSNYQIDLCCRINDDPELAKRAPSSHYPSKKAVGITLTLYCVRFLLTAGLWDHYVHQYTDLLESPHINARQQVLVAYNHIDYFFKYRYFFIYIS